MNNKENLKNPSRRNFLTGRIRDSASQSRTQVSRFSIELLGCSRAPDTESGNTIIKYTILNSGTERASIIVKRRWGEMSQVIKLIHLDANQTYDGTWTETMEHHDNYTIEAEARCNNATITREHKFNRVDGE